MNYKIGAIKRKLGLGQEKLKTGDLITAMNKKISEKGVKKDMGIDSITKDRAKQVAIMGLI